MENRTEMLHHDDEGKGLGLCGQAVQQAGERSGNDRNAQVRMNNTTMRVAWSAKPPVFTAEEAKLRYLLENGLCDPGSIGYCTGYARAL